MMTTSHSEIDQQLTALRRRMRGASGVGESPLTRAEAFLRRLSPSPEQPTPAETGSSSAMGRVAPLNGDLPDDVPDAAEVEVSAYRSQDAWDWVAVIQRVPTMERERQVPCAMEIEAGVFAQAILDGIESSEKQHDPELLALLVTRGRAAKQEMILGNLRLVLYWAQRWARGDATAMQDHFQEGFFGLHRAVLGWDALRGYTFSTYASWHLRQAMDRGRDNTAHTIRIPVHVQDTWDSPTSDLTRYARRLIAGLVSWEVLAEDPVFDVASVFAESVEEAVTSELVRETLLGALTCLSERQAEVLIMRHGLGGQNPQTLDEIGEQFGLTRERIRQIESKALRELRMHWLQKSLPYTRTEDWPDADAALLEACRISDGSFRGMTRAAALNDREAGDALTRVAARVDIGLWHY